MFVYCKRCALIANVNAVGSKCPVCEITFEQVPREYLTSKGFMFDSQAAKKEFEDTIINSEDFNKAAYERRDDVIARKKKEKQKEVDEKVKLYKSSLPEKKCPVCHSLALEKISNMGKVVKVSTLGILGAGDIGKTWRCNSCGLKF